jgi:hypothetical protein
LGSASGCRDSIAAFGNGQPASGRRSADQLLGALAARVADPQRDAKYDSARVRLATAAFLPSRVWSDTSVWSASQASRRTLFVNGRLNSNGHYWLEAAPALGATSQPAESRHSITLTRLADDEYAWDTDVAFSLGSVTARDFAAFFGALIAGAEGRNGDEVRAVTAAALPRASSVFATLLHVDSLRTTQLPDRSTLAHVAITITPNGLEPRFPNFARYMRRYAQTARLRWTLNDQIGDAFFDLVMRDGHVTIRVRTLNGKLVALTGPARPLPDSLTLNGELTLKVRAFTVGFRDYHGEFNLIRTDHERAWNIVSRREPHWVLPLITERLLRTPLRRPFQGSGAAFRIGVRDDTAGGQGILHRRLHLEVQESLILRFIGRLGAIAVGDYTGKAEREQYAWLNELVLALIADVRAP